MKRLLKLAVVVGVIAILAKLVADQMAQWKGLTESEVRDKLETKLPKFVPDEKRAEIADEIVSGMREQGVLADEDEPSEPAEPDGESSEVSEDITASA